MLHRDVVWSHFVCYCVVEGNPSHSSTFYTSATFQQFCAGVPVGEVLGVGRREQAQLALGLQAALTPLFFQGHSLFLSNILSFSQSLWDFISTSKSCPGCSLPAPQSFLVLQILTTHFPPATQCMWDIREPHTSTRYVPPPSTYCSPKRRACLCALLLGVLLSLSSLMKIISSTVYHHYLSFLLSQLGHTKIVISSMLFFVTQGKHSGKGFQCPGVPVPLQHCL